MSTTGTMPRTRLTARYEFDDGQWWFHFDEMRSVGAGHGNELEDARKVAHECASLQFSDWEHLTGGAYTALFSHIGDDCHEVFGPEPTKGLWTA